MFMSGNSVSGKKSSCVLLALRVGLLTFMNQAEAYKIYRCQHDGVILAWDVEYHLRLALCKKI